MISNFYNLDGQMLLSFLHFYRAACNADTV